MRALKAGQRIALTGTPVENRLTELWSIFQIVAPGLLGNATQFRQHFANPIEREHDPIATAELRRLTGPFLLRRTKADKSLADALALAEEVESLARQYIPARSLGPTRDLPAEEMDEVLRRFRHYGQQRRTE